jgi:IS30 family transposase
MGCKQLTFIQRCEIYGLWRAGYTQTRIAKEIGVHKSTISRELKRNITFVRA